MALRDSRAPFGLPGRLMMMVLLQTAATPRENRGRGFLCALAADLFGNARDGAVGDLEGGFGRGVAGAEARASGGEQNVHASAVGDGA